MVKVPCGGFKLDNNFLGMNENDELSLTGEEGGEGKNKSLVRSYLDGKVRWQNCPVFVTLVIDFETRKGECDIEFSLLASLIKEGVPIIANATFNRGQSLPPVQTVLPLININYDGDSKPLQILFSTVVLANDAQRVERILINYKADGSVELS